MTVREPCTSLFLHTGKIGTKFQLLTRRIIDVLSYGSVVTGSSLFICFGQRFLHFLEFQHLLLIESISI
jgi:hypothetical protein